MGETNFLGAVSATTVPQEIRGSQSFYIFFYVSYGGVC